MLVEPTLHPDFLVIINLLLERLVKGPFPSTIIQVASNGLPMAKRVLNELPESKSLLIDKGSFKSGPRVDYFTSFNDTPIDQPTFRGADFSKGCWVTSYCGMGLNKYGYYACSVAGGIDRVLGLDKGIRSLKTLSEDSFRDQLNHFCPYCGNFCASEINQGDFIPRAERAYHSGDLQSASWQKAYSDYSQRSPVLTEVYGQIDAGCTCTTMLA